MADSKHSVHNTMSKISVQDVFVMLLVITRLIKKIQVNLRDDLIHNVDQGQRKAPTVEGREK